jgi:hypothetical protein
MLCRRISVQLPVALALCNGGGDCRPCGAVASSNRSTWTQQCTVEEMKGSLPHGQL